jgi:hypothetical protein
VGFRVDKVVDLSSAVVVELDLDLEPEHSSNNSTPLLIDESNILEG